MICEKAVHGKVKNPRGSFFVLLLGKTELNCIIKRDYNCKTVQQFMSYKGGLGMEPVRIDSFCQFRFVSNPGFSPDGRYIAFVVRQADLKGNSYPGNLYY